MTTLRQYILSMLHLPYIYKHKALFLWVGSYHRYGLHSENSEGCVLLQWSHGNQICLMRRLSVPTVWSHTEASGETTPLLHSQSLTHHRLWIGVDQMVDQRCPLTSNLRCVKLLIQLDIKMLLRPVAGDEGSSPAPIPEKFSNRFPSKSRAIDRWGSWD